MPFILFVPLAMVLSIPVADGLTFPQPTGYVNDYADVIGEADAQALEARITAIERNSTAEIAVVTVPSLQNATIEDFAVQLFQAWGIGKRGSDNGLLILVAPNEREWKVEVGYGLEGDLPDAKVSRIARDCFTGNFTAGNYGEGLDCAVAAFGDAIGSATGTGLPYNIEYWQVAVAIVIFVILVIVTKGQILVWMLFIAKAFGFGGGRSGGGGGSGKW